MSNKSVSDFVAATMDAVLKSAEHKSLFGTQYKFASDENDAKCSKCGKDSCSCGDSMMADDNDARKKKKEEEGSSSSSSSDSSDADDGSSDGDSSAADDSDDSMESSAAYDVAIDSLLTASAALDSVGLDRGSAFSLKLASLVVEAKKKDSAKDSKDKAAKEKAKAKEKAAKEKEKKDSQAAKDKAAKEKAKAKEKADKEKAAAKAKADKEKASKKSGK